MARSTTTSTTEDRDGTGVDHAADVARARAGDAAAWSRLVRRYEGLLRHVARGFRLSRDDAEDVVQQTWLICVERLHQLQDDACFVGWVATVCRRECTRHVNRGRRCEPVDPAAEVFDGARAPGRGAAGADDVLADLVRREDLANLRRAIDALPPRQRDVLRALSAADFTDYVTAAQRVGVPVGSLGPTRARALVRLQADPRLALAG